MPQKSFTAYIYKHELEFLEWLVLQKRKIETGGDLFGCWQDENTAVVQLILGPGKDCRRTTVSFHQDVSYLEKVGDYLTFSQGLCNIGEWHSHHTLGLAEPSAGDQQTVWNHLPSVAGGRFLVFIANIRGTSAQPKVNIGCFLFNLSEQKMHRGEIKEISFPSPVRLSVDDAKISSAAEHGQEWKTFNKREKIASNIGTSAKPKVNIRTHTGQHLFNEQTMHRSEIKEISFPSQRQQTANNVEGEGSDSIEIYESPKEERCLIPEGGKSTGTRNRSWKKKNSRFCPFAVVLFVVVTITLVLALVLTQD